MTTGERQTHTISPTGWAGDAREAIVGLRNHLTPLLALQPGPEADAIVAAFDQLEEALETFEESLQS
jgi:hypothetical protein